jgi:hypothetical protein
MQSFYLILIYASFKLRISSGLNISSEEHFSPPILDTGHMNVWSLAYFFYPKKPSSMIDLAICMKVRAVVPYYLKLKL